MDNPIQVSKDGIYYPIEKYQELQRPFKLVSSGIIVTVTETDIPVYFVRKRMRMVGGKCVDKYVHRYCIGVITAEGKQETFWIHPNGLFDCKNTEQVKIKE